MILSSDDRPLNSLFELVDAVYYSDVAEDWQLSYAKRRMVLMSEPNSPMLEMKGITKSFPGVKALSDVDLTLFAGEVHILMGENGAGKSTLMKVLSGAYQYDLGDIFIRGVKQDRWSPLISQQHGVAMVYQEFNLVPYRTVLENLFLGREVVRGGLFLNKRTMLARASKLIDRFGLELDFFKLVSELSVAQQQMVEIAKALLFDARILVLDEPTAALTVKETEQLFAAIDQLRRNGVGIFYISHRLEEIKRIGDRVSVLRDGQYIGTRVVADVDVDEIVTMMVGREINMMYPRNYREAGDVALKISGVCTSKLNNVSFTVRYGEIVGLSGLVGAGRTEIARVIFGLDKYSSGTIEVDKDTVKKWDVPKAISKGIGYVSEDRKGEGLFLNLNIQKNMTIASLARIQKSGILNLSLEKKVATEYVDKLKIKTPSTAQKVIKLSGGNQQKIVIGKWLNTHPRIIIFDEPTRGIDVGAKVEIHTLMDKLVNEGNAVIMISSDLPEVMGMSDRIIVMGDGSVKGEFLSDSKPEEIIACAMGE